MGLLFRALSLRPGHPRASVLLVRTVHIVVTVSSVHIATGISNTIVDFDVSLLHF